jgi:hypothetical protein
MSKIPNFGSKKKAFRYSSFLLVNEHPYTAGSYRYSAICQSPQAIALYRSNGIKLSLSHWAHGTHRGLPLLVHSLIAKLI